MAHSIRFLLPTAALGLAIVFVASESAAASPTPQVPFPYVDTYFPSAPSPAASFSWKQRALDYDSFVYDRSSPGQYPTIYTDTTHYNMTTNSFKMPSYYGATTVDSTAATDGNQEGINEIASVVGASLVGIDKTNQAGYNYVDMLRTFYQPGIGVALNGPRESDGGAGSWWYTTSVNALYLMVGDRYATAPNMGTIQRSIADKYHDAVVALGGANADFTGQGFNFSTMSLNVGSRNEGGDGAVGTAAIELWAYSKFGDAKYLQAAEWSMDYLERTSGHLYYEVLPTLGPYLASRLNALYGTHYDVSRQLLNLMDGSQARYAWGAMRTRWGGYDVEGLQGAIIDNGPGSGGYAFAMNSFAASFLAPTVKYDTQYANVIGRYLLNLSNAARFFYADQMPVANQVDGSRFVNDPAHVIAYEALREQYNGASPMAMSDVTRSGFGGGDTDLGMYGGSWVGFLGATVADTNVANIRRIDVNALDFYGSTAYPTYLYYNPGNVAATVQLTLPAASGLYDAVTDSVLAASVSGSATIVVPPGGSRVVVLTPTNPVLVRAGGNTSVSGTIVGYGTGSADLAHDRPVTASSTVNNNLPSYVTDGYPSRRWESATADPQWLTVDLGSSQTVDRVGIDWEAASAKSFQVQISDDNSTWNTVYSTTSGPGGSQTVTFPATAGRYVRLNLTQRNTGYAYSILDLHVYRDDLAASATATASSTVNGNLPSYLTDGTTSMRWESQTSDPQWATVDLGAPTTVSRAVIRWEAASAKSFQLQTSLDNSNWNTVYSTTNGPGGVQNIPFTATTARYVRILMTQRNTTYAYSIYDLELYRDDLASFAPVVASSTANNNVAANLTDGTTTTRWESQTADPQWATVDLGRPSTVGRVVMKWEVASAKSFEIQVSNDGSSWTDEYATTAGPGGTQVVTFTPTTARYMRIYMTQRNTTWAYSMYDVEIFAA